MDNYGDYTFLLVMRTVLKSDGAAPSRADMQRAVSIGLRLFEQEKEHTSHDSVEMARGKSRT